MGVRIIEGMSDGRTGDAAVLYCSTTMWAFGPVMPDEETAEEFLKFVAEKDGRDPRRIPDSELEKLYTEFSRGVWLVEEEDS